LRRYWVIKRAIVGSVVPSRLSPAICSGLPAHRVRAIIPLRMGTKSRETLYGASIRAAAERAAETRKTADRLACEAWNKRMLGFQGRDFHGHRAICPDHT